MRTPPSRFWRVVERIVVALELPAVFALALAMALAALLSGRATAGLLLLIFAALIGLWWASLARPPRP